MHSITISVECDGGSELDCEARFEQITVGTPISSELDEKLLHEALMRGWLVVKRNGVLRRYLCPLHWAPEGSHPTQGDIDVRSYLDHPGHG